MSYSNDQPNLNKIIENQQLGSQTYPTINSQNQQYKVEQTLQNKQKINQGILLYSKQQNFNSIRESSSLAQLEQQQQIDQTQKNKQNQNTTLPYPPNKTPRYQQYQIMQNIIQQQQQLPLQQKAFSSLSSQNSSAIGNVVLSLSQQKYQQKESINQQNVQQSQIQQVLQQQKQVDFQNTTTMTQNSSQVNQFQQSTRMYSSQSYQQQNSRGDSSQHVSDNSQTNNTNKFNNNLTSGQCKNTDGEVNSSRINNGSNNEYIETQNGNIRSIINGQSQHRMKQVNLCKQNLICTLCDSNICDECIDHNKDHLTLSIDQIYEQSFSTIVQLCQKQYDSCLDSIKKNEQSFQFFLRSFKNVIDTAFHNYKIAEAYNNQDYNLFGQLFRRYYQLNPNAENAQTYSEKVDDLNKGVFYKQLDMPTERFVNFLSEMNYITLDEIFRSFGNLSTTPVSIQSVVDVYPSFQTNNYSKAIRNINQTNFIFNDPPQTHTQNIHPQLENQGLNFLNASEGQQIHEVHLSSQQEVSGDHKIYQKSSLNSFTDQGPSKKFKLDSITQQNITINTPPLNSYLGQNSSHITQNNNQLKQQQCTNASSAEVFQSQQPKVSIPTQNEGQIIENLVQVQIKSQFCYSDKIKQEFIEICSKTSSNQDNPIQQQQMFQKNTLNQQVPFHPNILLQYNLNTNQSMLFPSNKQDKSHPLINQHNEVKESSNIKPQSKKKHHNQQTKLRAYYENTILDNPLKNLAQKYDVKEATLKNWFQDIKDLIEEGHLSINQITENYNSEQCGQIDFVNSQKTQHPTNLLNKTLNGNHYELTREIRGFASNQTLSNSIDYDKNNETIENFNINQKEQELINTDQLKDKQTYILGDIILSQFENTQQKQNQIQVKDEIYEIDIEVTSEEQIKDLCKQELQEDGEYSSQEKYVKQKIQKGNISHMNNNTQFNLNQSKPLEENQISVRNMMTNLNLKNENMEDQIQKILNEEREKKLADEGENEEEEIDEQEREGGEKEESDNDQENDKDQESDEEEGEDNGEEGEGGDISQTEYDISNQIDESLQDYQFLSQKYSLTEQKNNIKQNDLQEQNNLFNNCLYNTFQRGFNKITKIKKKININQISFGNREHIKTEEESQDIQIEECYENNSNSTYMKSTSQIYSPLLEQDSPQVNNMPNPLIYNETGQNKQYQESVDQQQEQNEMKLVCFTLLKQYDDIPQETTIFAISKDNIILLKYISEDNDEQKIIDQQQLKGRIKELKYSTYKEEVILFIHQEDGTLFMWRWQQKQSSKQISQKVMNFDVFEYSKNIFIAIQIGDVQIQLMNIKQEVISTIDTFKPKQDHLGINLQIQNLVAWGSQENKQWYVCCHSGDYLWTYCLNLQDISSTKQIKNSTHLLPSRIIYQAISDDYQEIYKLRLHKNQKDQQEVIGASESGSLYIFNILRGSQLYYKPKHTDENLMQDIQVFHCNNKQQKSEYDEPKIILCYDDFIRIRKYRKLQFPIAMRCAAHEVKNSNINVYYILTNDQDTIYKHSITYSQ